MTFFLSVTVAAVAGMLVAGLLLALCRQAKGLLEARLALSEFQASCIAAALQLTALAMLPIAGWLTDTFGTRALLTSGSLLAAVAFLVLALARQFGAALAGALLLGNGTSCVLTASVVLLPKAFPDTHAVAALNLGFIGLLLGSLVAPHLLEFLRQRLNERRALCVLGLLSLLPALLAAVTGLEAFLAVDPRGPSWGLTERPEFWLLVLAGFLYAAVEAALSVLAPRYLQEGIHTERQAGWLLAGFWLAFLLARLAAALTWDHGWVHAGNSAWVALTLAIFAAIFLGNLVGAHSRRSSAVALLSVGALLGPVLPTLLGMLFDRLPTGWWGGALGTALAFSSLGGMVAEPVLGAYARRVTARQAFWVLAVAMLLVALTFFVLGIARNLGVTA